MYRRVPFQYTQYRILKAHSEFRRENYPIQKNDFLSFEVTSHAAQCRVIPAVGE